MHLTSKVKEILSHYESDSPGTKANLARMLMQGRLGGTGRMVILPVDQGSEHGPAASFSVNEPAYDPHYFFNLAIDSDLSAYAAPLGLLEQASASFAGCIPTILKVNNANSLIAKGEAKDQAVTASVRDALRLGCSAIGLTIYPGARRFLEMQEEARELIAEAKSFGLATVVWSYPREGDISKDGETALDICAYATHLAALMGAHIIKVKLPSDHLEQANAKKLYENIDVKDPVARVKHVMQAAFNGKRVVVFSGGAKKGEDSVFEDARTIHAGGGNGSIIGRNAFQRSRDEAMALLDRVVSVYQS